MKRYPHYWWNVHGSYCPSRIAVAVIDTDTGDCDSAGNQCDERVASWHLISVDMCHGQCGRTTYRAGESGQALLAALASLCSSKEQTWVIIPDAVRGLGASGFFRSLSAGDWSLTGRDWKVDRGCGKSGEDRTSGLCVIEDPPTLILCQPRGKPGKLLLLDARNYGITTRDLGTGSPRKAAELMAGILSIVSALRQDRPVSLRGTGASQAVQILRTRHDCRRLFCHTHGRATELERDAYFGGRVEAYRTGLIPGPVYSLDVRSMYASIMLDLPVPVSIRDYSDEPATATGIARQYPTHCIADVSIRHGGCIYPCRTDDGVCYPDGAVRTALAGPELSSAIGAGVVCDIHAVARYTCAPALRDFARYGLGQISDARGRQSTIVEQYWKRVLNALPGKFGEPGRRWVGCPPRTEREQYSEWIEPGPDGKPARHRNIAGYEQREEVTGESYWSMPAVSAFICSAARVRLLEILRCAGRENVWYCDTDGILCNGLAREKLLSGGFIRENTVGYLRTVGVYSRVHIYGVRHYTYDGAIKCSGVAHGEIGATETREDYWNRHPGSPETTLGYLRRLNERQ